jgi:hypothetical protein
VGIDIPVKSSIINKQGLVVSTYTTLHRRRGTSPDVGEGPGETPGGTEKNRTWLRDLPEDVRTIRADWCNEE